MCAHLMCSHMFETLRSPFWYYCECMETAFGADKANISDRQRVAWRRCEKFIPREPPQDKERICRGCKRFYECPVWQVCPRCGSTHIDSKYSCSYSSPSVSKKVLWEWWLVGVPEEAKNVPIIKKVQETYRCQDCGFQAVRKYKEEANPWRRRKADSVATI